LSTKGSMRQAAHARALEVQKYCCTVPRVHLSQRYSSGLVALAMEIHFLAIDKSNVAEGIARSWTKVHPSILPRQPEATIHCNAASARPARVLESASPAHGIRGIFSSTLASKRTRLETRHQLLEASVIDHATHAPAIVPTP
jgi:hypothetical protein